MSTRHVYAALIVLAVALPAASGGSMQESTPTPPAPTPPVQPDSPPPAAPASPAPQALGYPVSVDALLDEIDRLRLNVDALRQELAQSRLDGNATQRALDELRQFIADHERYGADFERYRAVKAAAERESQRRRAESARQEAEALRAQRAGQQHAALEQRARDQEEFRRSQEYRTAGFSPLGLDVYLGASSFNYKTTDGFDARYDWNGLTGGYLRLYPSARVDFSSMTISGSVLNGDSAARNLGVAVTFFNEVGAQVGGEIIQVDNARPGVPYPFTATIAMALDRPFWSASTYVVYADPVEPP